MKSVKLRPRALGRDPELDLPILLLEEVDGERGVPIWTRDEAAGWILSILRGEPKLPPGLNFLIEVLEAIGYKLKSVTVVPLPDESYEAKVLISSEKLGELPMVGPVCEMLALALELGADILIEEEVLEASPWLNIPDAGFEDLETRMQGAHSDPVRRFLRATDPGKWRRRVGNA